MPTQRTTAVHRTHEYLRQLAFAEPKERPALPTRRELDRFSEAERTRDRRVRTAWHGSPPIMRTQPVVDTQEHLTTLVDAQRDMSPVGEQRVGFWVDAESSTGKTTTVFDWMRTSYLERWGEFSDDERDYLVNGPNLFIPFAYVSLSERPTARTINQALCRFYEHPETSRYANSTDLADVAVDLFASCRTEVVFLDDAHMLANKWANNDATSGHLKYLMSEAPVTLVLLSADARRRDRLLSEDLYDVFERSQMAHRFAPYTMEGFSRGTREWKRVVMSVAKRIVLTDFDADAFVRMHDLLFDMTGGFLGSLWLIIRTACVRAIRDRTEALPEVQLERAHKDWAAKQRLERLRRERTLKPATRRSTHR